MIGLSRLRIMATHVLPNVLGPVLVVATLNLSLAILAEATLSFLGVGVQPPTPTFGSIIADGRKYLLNAWWIATMPGVFLCLTLTGINLIGAAFERARNAIHGGA